MAAAPSKPPHSKLQNDSAGIDPDFGSIYVIPAPTDYVDDEDIGPPLSTAPHQLIPFGPNREMILVIPDYRVNKVLPGVSRKPLIGEEQMIRTTKPDTADANQPQKASAHIEAQEASSSPAPSGQAPVEPTGKTAEADSSDSNKKASSTSSTGSSPDNLNANVSDTSNSVSHEELVRLIAVEYREKHIISAASPLTSLAVFTGADGAILLDMFDSWDVKSLEAFTKFPQTHPESMQLLLDAGMFSDIKSYVSKVKMLLQNPPSSLQTEPQAQQQAGNSAQKPSNVVIDLTTSRVYPSASPSSTTQENAGNKTYSTSNSSPVTSIPSVTPEIAATLATYALIGTVKELAAFPSQFPGIYAILKQTGEIGDLEKLVASAAALCADAPPASGPGSASSTSDLGSTRWLNHLGEAQRPNMAIDDISKTTLVHALKDMPTQLAVDLAHLYPPIQTLQALATFADVNPTEYNYLLRSYPMLSSLCQQAALLVSVANGHKQTPSV